MVRALIIGLAVLAIGAEAGAQVPGVEAGDRVRITPAPSNDRVLVVASVDSQSLTLTGARTRREVTVPLGAIETLERSVGRRRSRSSVVKGAAFGLIAGAAAGAGLVSVKMAADDPWRDQAVGVLAAAGGILGAGIGGFAGAAMRTDQWESVPVARRFGVLPTRRGVAVGTTVSF